MTSNFALNKKCIELLLESFFFFLFNSSLICPKRVLRFYTSFVTLIWFISLAAPNNVIIYLFLQFYYLAFSLAKKLLSFFIAHSFFDIVCFLVQNFSNRAYIDEIETFFAQRFVCLQFISNV